MKADKRSINQWLGSQNYHIKDEAIEILRDIFNEDYSVKEFQNDVSAYFEPNDREEV